MATGSSRSSATSTERLAERRRLHVGVDQQRMTGIVLDKD
jgi:hypothetical protein